jgi:iron complex outermembrane recepter protein
MRQAIAVIVLLLVATPAVAQQPPPPPTLPPVVVEGQRLPGERTETEQEAREEIQRVPGSVDLVPRERIEESRAANLKDVLDFTPGVLIRPRFGADESQISIRGSGLRNNFHLRGINLLIDGFPYGNADGFSDFEALELLTTKRIEVYKGPAALRFGGNTLGGAINLVSRTGYDGAPLEVRGEGGSFGFWKFYLGSGMVLGPFDSYVGLSDTELHGYRDHAEQLRRRAYVTVGDVLPGGTTVRVDLNYTRSEENLPGALTEHELDTDPRKAEPGNVFGLRVRAARSYDYVRGAITVRTPLTGTQALEWATQLNYQDLNHPLSFAVIDDTTYAYSTELRWIRVAPLFEHANRTTVGLQYSGTRQIDVQLDNTPGLVRTKLRDQLNIADTVGLYAENQLDVTPAFTLVLGGRGQYSIREVRDRFLIDGNQSDSVDFLAFTPTLGFVARPARNVQIYANASRAYEPPLLLEITAPGNVPGTLSDLKAQKAWQFELGTRGTWGARLAWDVGVYDIELWDEIQNVNVKPFPTAFFTIPRYRNLDRSRHTGAEVGLDVLVAKDLTPGDALRARAAYTWSRFVFVNDKNFGNNRLPGAPDHFVRAELRYDHASGVWVAPNAEATPQGYFVNSENDAGTRPYALLGLRAGYDYKPWNVGLIFEARNLTDVTYASSVVVDAANRRFFEPGDGRAFYGTLQWAWK